MQRQFLHTPQRTLSGGLGVTVHRQLLHTTQLWKTTLEIVYSRSRT